MRTPLSPVFLLLFPVSFSALVLVAERAALWWRGLRNRLYGIRRGRRAGLPTLRDETVRQVADLVEGELSPGPPTHDGVVS